MVARHVELWERVAERYVLLGVLRGAQIFICFFRGIFFFFDLRDGLGRKGGTASDQIHLTIIRQITSEGEGNYLMTKLSNSTGPWCYITVVNATCTLSYTGRSFFQNGDWTLKLFNVQVKMILLSLPRRRDVTKPQRDLKSPSLSHQTLWQLCNFLSNELWNINRLREQSIQSLIPGTSFRPKSPLTRELDCIITDYNFFKHRKPTSWLAFNWSYV